MNLDTKQKGRSVLTRRDPKVEALCVGLDLDPQTLAAARVFGKNLWAERNRWSITQARRGLFSARPISRQTAERILKTEFAALAGGAK